MIVSCPTTGGSCCVSNVIITVSLVTPQKDDIDHSNSLGPTLRLVIVERESKGSVTIAELLITFQVPVPTIASFPSNV